MDTSTNIRTGGASVEIVADARKLDTGLREAESKLRAYNQRVRQLNKEATAAAKAGDQGQAIRLGTTARELEKRSQRMTERSSTLSQRDDARGALAQRLASFKAGKAALLSDQSDLEERLAAATMKPRDLALRDLDRHFAQMRSKYVGNATMLQRIEQTAAAERAKVNSDYSTGIIGGLGGKRLAKQEMRYAAASLAGVAGGEVGMVAMTLLSGAGMAAAVVAPLLVLGVAFKGMVDAVNAVKASVKAWGEQLDRTAALRVGVNRTLHPPTANESEINSLNADIAKITEEQKKVHDTDTKQSWTTRMFMGNAPQEYAASEKDRNLDMLEASRQKLIKKRDALKDTPGEPSAVRDANADWERQIYYIGQAKAAEEELFAAEMERAGKADERADQVKAMADQYGDATNAALTGGVAGQREAQWQGVLRTMQAAKQTQEDIDKVHALVIGQNIAEDNRAVLDQITEMADRLAVATGKASELDVEMARIAREHPEASAENLAKLRSMKEKTDLAQFVKGELEGIKTPAEKFKDYRDRLDKAVGVGVLTQSQMEALLASKMAEAMGVARNVGGFNVSAINQMVGGGGSVAERTAKAGEETAKNTRKLVDGQGSGGTFL
jgi:hypothetical protein